MSELEQLYESDFNLWVEQIVNAIKDRNFKEMDWDNLIDEVEDMAKSEKRSPESYLERSIEHILKLRFWGSKREQNYKHWQAEVVNFRNRIQRLLKISPSLKKYMHEIYAEVYRDTVDSRKIEFDIPENNFIELEQMLRRDYFG